MSVGTYQDNWYDSEELHREAAAKRRGKWQINGVNYLTLREASKSTGIHQGTIIKHTFQGVFNEITYAAACKTARVKNKLIAE